MRGEHLLARRGRRRYLVVGVTALSRAGSLGCRRPSTRSNAHVDGEVTYVPIPPGTGESLAGMLTVDLPATVVKGQEFNIVIPRRIGTRRVAVATP